MKLTPIVCAVLFGLLLVPTDGRLKYAGHSSSGGHTELNEAEDRTMSQSNVTKEEEEEEEEQQEEEMEPGSHHCHHSPPAHYGWTLHRLSQQLAAAAAATAAATAAAADHQKDNDDGGKVRGPWGRAWQRQSTLKKRTSVDYGRELSADLYAQYPSSCACQTKYELLDLGYTHFPRYIVNAICQNRSASSRKCWRGSSCKEIPYKVRVLTRRSDGAGEHGPETDHHSTLLPEPLRAYWRFKTVTIAAACQCSL